LVLRDAGGAWYGEDDLWASVPAVEAGPVRLDDGTYRLKHAWITLDRDGHFTSRKGPPAFEGKRLDAPGEADGSSGGYASTDQLKWWPTAFDYPSAGCWAEIATLGETRVRLVLEVS
jgi:hypothetical protein